MNNFNEIPRDLYTYGRPARNMSASEIPFGRRKVEHVTVAVRTYCGGEISRTCNDFSCLRPREISPPSADRDNICGNSAVLFYRRRTTTPYAHFCLRSAAPSVRLFRWRAKGLIKVCAGTVVPRPAPDSCVRFGRVFRCKKHRVFGKCVLTLR